MHYTKQIGRWALVVGAVGLLLGAVPASAQGLTFEQVIYDNLDVDGLGGPRLVKVSPDGRHLYVASEEDSAVAVFARDPQTGEVSFVEAELDGVNGVEGLFGLAGVDVSPDGRHVYVSAAFGSSVAAFERDPATGELDFIEAEFNGVDGVSGIRAAVWVEVSPDGGHVYVVGIASDSIAIFDRDRRTGELDFVGTVVDGVDGVDGLNGVFAIDLSPSGSHLYAGGIVDDAVAVFERDRRTGELHFQQVLFDGAGGVDGLNGPRDLRVSRDGRNVYVASLVDGAVAVFDRQPGSGELSFVEAHFDGQGGIDSLAQAVAVIPSADGHRVYAASFGEDAIVTFDRDPADGRLTFVGEVVDGMGAVEGLDGIISLIPSLDGGNLYGVSFFDSSLVVFDVTD